MIINHVEASGFCKFKNQVAFTLNNQGLLLIVGDNQDDTSANSNGSGKSTIPDLITWIIWGVTAKGVSGDDVIHWGLKEAKGEIDIIDGDELISIRRTRKKGKEELRLQFTDKIGETFDETCGTLKLTQDKIAKVLGCTYETFRAAVYVGQEDLLDLPSMTDKQLKELVERAAGIDALERAYSLARERLSASERALRDAQQELELVMRRYVMWCERRKDAIEAQTQWKSDHAIKCEESLENGRRLAALLATLEDKLAKMPSKMALKAAVQSIESKFKNEERDKLKTHIDRLGFELNNALHNLNHPVENSRCDKCGSFINEVNPQHEIDLKRDIERLTKQLNKAQGELAKFGSHDSSELAVKLSKLNVALAAIQAIEHQLQDAQKAVSNCEIHRRNLISAENPYDNKISQFSHDLEIEQHNVENYKQLVSESESNLEKIKSVVEVFSPAGVRAHVLDQVTPFLNERTSFYLSSLSDGNIVAVWNTLTKNAKGELREKFVIEVTYGENGSFKDLSGGEKRKVRIACALALQDLIASRASKSFGFYCVDEIDTALDSAGLERLMGILQEKAKTTGTVAVISHSDLKNWCSNIWTIRRSADHSCLVI